MPCHITFDHVDLIEFDLEKYTRKEHFKAFLYDLDCRCSFTVRLDVTHIYHIHKQHGIPFYAILIYILGVKLNEKEYFRLIPYEGKIYTMSRIDPCYTIFHEENNTFSSIYSIFDKSFSCFLSNYREDNLKYKDVLGYMTKPLNTPYNYFYVSAVTGLAFSEFNVEINAKSVCLQPVITFGRLEQAGDVYTIPMSVKFHHSIADGYHMGLLVSELQSLLEDFTPES